MAIVQSVNSTSTLRTTNVVVSAPAGIQTGDSLIAVIGATSSGVTGVPSGWFLSETQIRSTVTQLYFYYKVAILADETATNYTWTTPTSQGYGGVILRVEDLPIDTDPLYSSYGFSGVFDENATESYTHTLSKPSPSLIVLAGVGVFDAISYSNYTLTHGTSNPTWTEVVDANNAGGNEPSFFCAYTTTSDTSDITAFGFDVVTVATGSAVAAALILGVYANQTDTPGTNALLSVSPTLFSNTAVEVGGTGTNALLDVPPTIFSQSGRGETPTVWTPEVKTATTWTPEIK